MKLYCVYRENYITDFRVHPIGSEFYVEESLIGAFPKKDKAEDYIWKYIDDLIKENSLTAIVKQENDEVVLKYLNNEKDIFTIRLLNSDDIF